MTRKKTGEIRLRGGRTGTARNDALVYVSIYCRGTIKAPHDKWRIASFMPSTHDADLIWSESDGGYAETGAVTLIRVYPHVTQWLDGSEYIHRDSDDGAVIEGEQNVDVFYRDSFRIGWMLKCETCSFARKIGSPRDAYPLLTALAQEVAQEGVAEIPVREFCRRVTKQLD